MQINRWAVRAAMIALGGVADDPTPTLHELPTEEALTRVARRYERAGFDAEAAQIRTLAARAF